MTHDITPDGFKLVSDEPMRKAREDMLVVEDTPSSETRMKGSGSSEEIVVGGSGSVLDAVCRAVFEARREVWEKPKAVLLSFTCEGEVMVSVIDLPRSEL